MISASKSHQEGWADLRAESGGMVNIHVLQPADLVEAMAAAAEGNEIARCLSNAGRGTIVGVHKAARARKPMLCLCCPRPLGNRRPYSIVVALPAADTPKSGMAMAVCAECAVDVEDVRRAAIRKLKASVWPDLREVTPHPVAGHA